MPVAELAAVRALGPRLDRRDALAALLLLLLSEGDSPGGLEWERVGRRLLGRLPPAALVAALAAALEPAARLDDRSIGLGSLLVHLVLAEVETVVEEVVQRVELVGGIGLRDVLRRVLLALVRGLGEDGVRVVGRVLPVTGLGRPSGTSAISTVALAALAAALLALAVRVRGVDVGELGTQRRLEPLQVVGVARAADDLAALLPRQAAEAQEQVRLDVR